MQFTITAEEHKMRLDKFLKEHFPDFSRTYLQKLIAAGKVKVAGRQVSAHHFLKAGDEVEATIEPPQELSVAPNPAVRFEVLHEETEFIVVNKPAGLVVHQAEGHKAPDTLVNGLLARYKDSPSSEGLSFSRVGDDPVRPGIVHRLDGDASGVMVVARTQDMFDYLKKQFKAHEVEKEYVAVVEGKVSPAEGVIEFLVARKGARMVARPNTPHPRPLPQGERENLRKEGRRAVTEYETIKTAGRQDSRTTLLKIVTHTGRTHQIRVHLKAKGWPIVGDRLYGKTAGQQDSRTAPRLMLHARRIAFKDLQGKKREFIVEPDWKELAASS